MCDLALVRVTFDMICRWSISDVHPTRSITCTYVSFECYRHTGNYLRLRLDRLTLVNAGSCSAIHSRRLRYARLVHANQEARECGRDKYESSIISATKREVFLRPSHNISHIAFFLVVPAVYVWHVWGNCMLLCFWLNGSCHVAFRFRKTCLLRRCYRLWT